MLRNLVIPAVSPFDTVRVDPDAAMTRIVEAADADAAMWVMREMSTKLLRAVADLCDAVDYPDTASRPRLMAGILAAAR